jgi:hypothetical protein
MNSNETMVGWARRCVADGQWLLHVPTFVLGLAETYSDGEAGPVVGFVGGHSFVANPNAFVEVSSMEVAYYRMLFVKYAEIMKISIQAAVDAGIPVAKTITLVSAVLRAHTRAIESAVAS